MSTSSALHVNRLPFRLKSDASRTIVRFFWAGPERAARIINRVLSVDPWQRERMLEQVLTDFAHRHEEIEDILTDHCESAMQQAKMNADLDREQKLLIGSFFTMEYAFESAALFNPSMVAAGDQTGVGRGCLRFIMSLRAVGEGHISSIVFRQGIIGPDGNITVNPPRMKVKRLGIREDYHNDKEKFQTKIRQMGVNHPGMDIILGRLGETFTNTELFKVIESHLAESEISKDLEMAVNRMKWLAKADYEIQYDPQDDLEELVLFPLSETESQGMEDLRAVMFTDEDGSVRFVGTYTAYNGREIIPQIIEAREPGRAFVQTLHGRYAQNKGMALFPKRIDGRYCMIGRIDGENLFLLKSDNIIFWDEAEILKKPEFPWEFVQIGNCGSPIETPEGWLLLTHGVGPMRRYCIGAMLLDREDPSKIIGQLHQPLLSPADDERSGYVPNVVYTCGGLIHNGILVIPYGISDAAVGVAEVKMDELLAVMTR